MTCKDENKVQQYHAYHANAQALRNEDTKIKVVKDSWKDIWLSFS
jgi:hypothetical protein